MANSWNEISEVVRSRLVVNTTTALKGHKHRQDEYREGLPITVRKEADEAVQLLAAQRVQRAGKKEYDYIVYPYLSQLTSVLRECRRVLKRGSRAHIVVSDAALYGVHLDTPRWLGEIGATLGFRTVAVELIRSRGQRWLLDKRDGSEKGLGEYYVQLEK